MYSDDALLIEEISDNNFKTYFRGECFNEFRRWEYICLFFDYASSCDMSK